MFLGAEPDERWRRNRAPHAQTHCTLHDTGTAGETAHEGTATSVAQPTRWGRHLAARLVVVLARAHLADLLAHVVGELEVLLGDQLLHLRARGLDVLRLDGGLLLTLGGEVRGVDVAVGQEDGHTVLRLAAHRLELLEESAEAVALGLDVLRGGVVGAGREGLGLLGDLRLGRRRGLTEVEEALLRRSHHGDLGGPRHGDALHARHGRGRRERRRKANDGEDRKHGYLSDRAGRDRSSKAWWSGKKG